MRIYFAVLFSIIVLLRASAQRNEILVSDIKTLQVTINSDWLLPPIIELGTDDYLDITFDELTREYSRFNYSITHCNADWSASHLSELDYLNGFNNNPIEDYQPSFNTTMLYTHYSLRIPNEDISLTASGNYVVTIFKNDTPETPVLKACFSILEKVTSVSATVSSNTDIDTNTTHQQVSFSVNHAGYTINNPTNEIKVQVFQNQRWDNRVTNLFPTYISNGQLQYTHKKELIFDGGNEYRRFEATEVHYATMGVEKITYFEPYFHAELFVDERKKNYSFDIDQNGRYFIRYSQAQDSVIEADYIFVHFTLNPDGVLLPEGDIYLQGAFTYDRFSTENKLTYNPQSHMYECVQLLKQGAYNYTYLYVPKGSNVGNSTLIEGSFYETENEYMILVYHRPFGERYDKLIGMQIVKFEQ